MDEEFIRNTLTKIRGAKRAKRGVLLPIGDEGYFHLTNVIRKEDSDGLSNEEMFYVSFCSRNEIIRLREIKSAHDYLLRVRAEAIVDNPRAIRVFLERKEKYERQGKQWSLTHYYHSKDAYQKQYINNLPKAVAKHLRGIPSGMAWITEANAICMRSLVGDLVVVSEGLEYFFYFMNIGIYGGNYGFSSEDTFHALLIALRIMIGAESLDFDMDSRGDIPLATNRILWSRVSSQMQFTFGHEYAHKLKGHLSSPAQDESLVYSHDLEFEADVCAISVFNKQGAAFESVRDGAITTLIFLSFLEYALQLMTTTKLAVSSTHPSSRYRLQKVCGWLGKESPLKPIQIDELLGDLEERAELMNNRLSDQEDNALSMYGSVYLPSYKKRILADRIEI